MSHFTVILTQAPTSECIEEQLLPFCENTESLPEQYVVFQDQTEEYQEEYQTKGTTTFTAPSGQSFNAWDNVERKGDSYHASPFASNASHRPEKWMETEKGWQKQFLPYKEIYATFEVFCEEYHGMEPNAEGRYGYLTNPHAKWDWYTLGGRWRGFFRLLPGCVVGELGDAGVFDNPALPNHVDWVEKQYIDFDGMMMDAKESAETRYVTYQSLLAAHGPAKTWDVAEKEATSLGVEARTLFWEQPLIKAMQEHQLLGLFSSPEDVFAYGDGTEKSAQEYIETHRLGALIPFALLHEGRWHQRGEMGWFGTHQSEMTYAEWVRHAWGIIEALPPNSKLALMDCHI